MRWRVKTLFSSSIMNFTVLCQALVMIISRSSLPKYVTKTSKTISNDRQNSSSMWRSYCFFFIRESVYEIKMCVEVQLGIEDVYLIE